VRLNRLNVKCPAGISATRDGFPPELNPKWAGQLTWTRAWDVCGNRPWRHGRHVKQLIGILAKPSPHFSTWDMMATPKEKNVPHLPGSATTITKSGRLSRSPKRYGHSSRWPGRRIWKHILIRTEVKPIARLQQYHLPPVVQDDISYPSEIGKPRVQLHDDDLTTEARPWSGLARLREENASVTIYALWVAR
jgi:hypothetical protein